MYFCLKELPLNTKHNFALSCQLIVGERLFLVVKGVVSFSVDKSLDFHDRIFSLSPSLYKV